MSKTTLDVLKQAREAFRDHGGAVGALRDGDGRVCAVGALDEVADCIGIFVCATPATESNYALSKSACALYGCNVAAVNDDLGTDAVLHCYDHAIKTLEAQA